MRLFSCLLFLFIFKISYSNQKPDSTRAKFVFNGNVSLNSNGMAPIPSFSLGKPALIGAFTLQKRRFSYDPQIAFALNMKPWIIDNWLHYRLIYKPKFELRTGVDFSMFFSEYNTGEYKILKGEQYIAFEIAGIIKFSPKSILSLMYWSDNGQDPGTIRGNFYNAVYERNDIRIGRSVLFAASLQLFSIAYTGANDGLFVSPKIATSVRNIPLSLYFQATQCINSNIEPNPGFRWNAGIAYIF